MGDRGEFSRDAEQLAPVIPLFGKNAPRGEKDSSSPLGDPSESHARRRLDDEAVPRGSAAPVGDASAWHPTWRQSAVPLDATTESTGASTGSRAVDGVGSGASHSAEPSRTAPRLRALRSHDQFVGEPPSDTWGPAQVREAAEELLVRKLRSKSLSIAEARAVLRGYESQGQRVDGGQIDDIIDDFCRRGYLDDAVLAAHLVVSGAERKGQGRVALARTLAQRGLPRDAIDTALEELPDDDAERALEYARTKARSLARLDNETALRRLVGQLARRGYNGSLAMSAARKALAEASFGQGASGVRFVDSD